MTNRSSLERRHGTGSTSSTAKRCSPLRCAHESSTVNLQWWSSEIQIYQPTCQSRFTIRTGSSKILWLKAKPLSPYSRSESSKNNLLRLSLARKRNRLRRGDSSAALSGVGVKTAQQFREERCRQKMKIQGLCGTIF